MLSLEEGFEHFPKDSRERGQQEDVRAIINGSSKSLEEMYELRSGDNFVFIASSLIVPTRCLISLGDIHPIPIPSYVMLPCGDSSLSYLRNVFAHRV
jgi:hypothetical protein